MEEFVKALCALFCATTYWLGGQEIPFLGRGFKWLRRYVLPVGLLFFLLALKAPIIQSIAACALLSGALHMGYQNKLWKYALTGLAMGLPALIISRNGLFVLPCFFHTAFGFISLKYNKFEWAWVAILVGFGIGVAYISGV